MNCIIPSCDREASARGWCDRHYRRWLHYGDPLFDRKPGRPPGWARPMIERVLQRIEVAPSGCWMWQGAALRVGYGVINGGDGHNYLTHRVVYEAAVGPIPEGLVLDHLCHNADLDCPGGPPCVHRRCCNPDHLRAITRAENAVVAPHLRRNQH